MWPRRWQGHCGAMYVTGPRTVKVEVFVCEEIREWGSQSVWGHTRNTELIQNEVGDSDAEKDCATCWCLSERLRVNKRLLDNVQKKLNGNHKSEAYGPSQTNSQILFGFLKVCSLFVLWQIISYHLQIRRVHIKTCILWEAALKNYEDQAAIGFSLHYDPWSWVTTVLLSSIGFQFTTDWQACFTHLRHQPALWAFLGDSKGADIPTRFVLESQVGSRDGANATCWPWGMKEWAAPLGKGEAGLDKKMKGIDSEKSEVMNGCIECGHSRGQTWKFW